MYFLRPWKLSDASFVLKMRNDPERMRYFRQSKPLILSEQLKFMKQAPQINYHGYILYNENNERLGVFAMHGSEVCIAAPLKYHAVGLNILTSSNPLTMFFGDVFSTNPALSIYLKDCGFTVFDVKEKYCKKDGEWISVIKISKY